MHHRHLTVRIFFWFLTLALATVTFSASAQDMLRVLDVGEGLAVTLQSGSQRAMIDSGNWFSGARITRKIFEEDSAPLEWVALTHLHPDHLGGAPALKTWLSPKKWYDNGEKIAGSATTGVLPWLRWYDNEIRKNPAVVYQRLLRGDRLKLGTLDIEILSPPFKGLGADVNTNSLVLKVTKRNECILVMGDAQEPTEAFLLRAPKADIRCSVVVVGHHGASNASSNPFVLATHAKTALISTDKNNLNGFPDRAVVMRWKEIGAAVLLTADQGDLTTTFESDGSVRTKSER